jgi:BolA protein
MKNYLVIIKEKITQKLSLEKINIVDNSHKHRKHKFFDSKKYHLSLEIESKYLNSLKKIDAQRMVMSVLKEELATKLHALEIKIK